MITVSVKQLMDAIEEANAFQLPDMNDGVRYIYNDLYGRLSRGMEVRLSKIDYNSFELDDIDSMRELYSATLEVNEYKADRITRTLHGLPPVVTATVFV